MKKAFKKIMVMVLMFTLVFTFTVKPKKTEAFVGEMTIASWLAAGGTMATVGPIVVGLAGAAVIGAYINGNWDTIEEYGTIIYDDLIGQGKTPEEIYQQDTDGGFTVTATNDFIKSASRAVDTLPDNIPTDNGLWNRIPDVTMAAFTVGTAAFLPAMEIPAGGKLAVRGHIYATGANDYGNTETITVQYLRTGGTSYDLSLNTHIGSVAKLSVLDQDFSYTKSFTNATSIANARLVYSTSYGRTMAISELEYLVYTDPADLTATKTVPKSDTFGTVADNDYQRQLEANAALADNQLITIGANQDLTNATLSDLTDITAADYDETRTQTGILSGIWQSIKAIPGSIVAASSAAAASINAKAQELWDDAGAIWTGIADTATGIKADINAKIGSLSDSMAGGIDNIRTGINDMMANLRAGIDTVATNVAAWGQLTLDGIDAGVGAITSGLTTVWDKVAAIPAAIDTAATNTIETVTGWFVLSEPQKLENQQNMSSARELFLSKFDWIKTPIEQLKSVYSQRKSLHDVSITILGQEVYILPQQFAGTVSMLRSVLSGSAILTTIIYIYRRVQPKEVV